MYLLRFDGFDVVGSSPEALVKVADGRAMMHPIAGHPVARRHARGGRRAGRRPARRPQGARRAPHARRPRPQRPRPRLRAGHRRGRRLHVGRALQPRHAHRVAPWSGRSRRAARRTTCSRPASRPAPSPARPKPRAMEIIEELEPTRRGVYGGCVGYLDFAGDADTAIAIRTASCATGRPTSRPAPASSPTPTRPPRTRSAATRRWRCCAPWRRRGTLRAARVTARARDARRSSVRSPLGARAARSSAEPRRLGSAVGAWRGHAGGGRARLVALAGAAVLLALGRWCWSACCRAGAAGWRRRGHDARLLGDAGHAVRRRRRRRLAGAGGVVAVRVAGWPPRAGRGAGTTSSSRPRGPPTATRGTRWTAVRTPPA